MRAAANAFAFISLFMSMVGAAFMSNASAETAVANGVTYELIAEWDVDKLNSILTQDAPEFFGIKVDYTPATNAVKLYRITYSSVVPEKGNLPIQTTGLLAIPVIDQSSFPLVSYQHGTVFGKEQVPSFPDNSSETRLMLAQFAGQGYVMIGADYFGMGASKQPEGYLVKASHQQATFDLLQAAKAVLTSMNISTTKLFLGGWSQGGFVTMAFTEKLENSGITVDAAATASAPTDGTAVIVGALQFPRKIDASWYSLVYILTAFSFEEYYGVPGLARALFTEESFDLVRRIYQRDNVSETEVPTDLKAIIRPEYFDTTRFESSTYGRLIGQTQAYKHIFKSPIRNYYGELDEVVTPGLGRLAAEYQHAIGQGNLAVEAISTGDTSHRETFAKAVPEWKKWFDSK